MWPFSPSPESIAEEVQRLYLFEEAGRKYRAKGDWAYDDGRQRACTEYHLLAGEDETRAAEARAALRARLGEPGALEPVDEARATAAREQSKRLPSPWGETGPEFAPACFYARYPRWCGSVAAFREAFARWSDDPRFQAEAPRYRPINPDWD